MTSCENNEFQEESKIKKVILMETEAYKEGDIEKWKSTVTQSSKMVYVYGLDDGTTNQVIGFESLEKMMMEWMTNKVDSDYKTIERTGWNININNNVSWVTYREKAMLNGKVTIGEEIRVLEKINGDWKLDLVSFIF